jgi:hypothetical protein
MTLTNNDRMVILAMVALVRENDKRWVTPGEVREVLTGFMDKRTVYDTLENLEWFHLLELRAHPQKDGVDQYAFALLAATNMGPFNVPSYLGGTKGESHD